MSTPTNGPGPEGYPQNPNNGGYPPPGYPQQPPKKKRKKWPWIVGGIVVLLILIFAGCAALVGGAVNSVDQAMNSAAPADNPTAGGSSSEGSSSDGQSGGQATGNDIALSGTATGEASVTYGSLGSTSTADVNSEWSKTVTPQKDDTYNVSIQDSSGAEDATVTCKIVKGGKTLDEQKATGAYSIASCTQPLF